VAVTPTFDPFAMRSGSVAASGPASRRSPRWALDDPERAQRHRLERDRLVAADAVRHAEDLGIRVIEVDGSRDAAAIAGEVAAQFGPYLPR
jgi:hypothetical protein